MNVTRLCKTPSHGHLLITGGTEGQAKFWVGNGAQLVSSESHITLRLIDSLLDVGLARERPSCP